MVDRVDSLELNLFYIRNIHAILSYNLLGNPQASGQVRKIPVGISGTVYHPLEIPHLIQEELETIVQKGSEIVNPFEQAFFLMVHLPYLQPFEDVNKRVSRIAANLPLMKKNVCPLSFIDIPEQIYVDGILGVYELNRVELLRDVFVWAYERSCRRYTAMRHSISEPDPFRMKFQREIQSIIQEVVHRRLDKENASLLIQKWAQKHLPERHQSRYVEVVETELLSLHIGNIAIFSLTIEEFEKWKKRFS